MFLYGSIGPLEDLGPELVNIGKLFTLGTRTQNNALWQQSFDFTSALIVHCVRKQLRIICQEIFWDAKVEILCITRMQKTDRRYITLLH